jgi:kynurenine formamidase
MPERPLPTRDEAIAFLRDRRNWGRWGEDDQKGAINLITAAKRVDAAGLVRTGRIVSLSRDFPKRPGPGNPQPGQHFVQWGPLRQGGGGGATDYYGIAYHGYQTTHIDALCHVWDEGGMWGGRKPEESITPYGVRWGGVEQWRDGIITRGVLLDVARFRGEPSVTPERPVHGWELEDVARAQGVELQPGDALLVHSGRDAWEAAHPEWNPYGADRPGLHVSCLPFIRDHDVALLGWDLMDATPNEYGLPWPVHGALYSYGVALLDNCRLGPLAAACAEEGRYEFMLTVAPLPVVGGTGSPANPLALF